MNREQLAHLLRSAARIVTDGEIVVLGSQAILGSYDEHELPPEAVRSMEADLAFADDPNASKADKVDGAIGEGSRFHEEFAYYAQGISLSTAVLPDGWKHRVVTYDRADGAPDRTVCLEHHDLVVSKLVAGREKDTEFAEALLRYGLVNAVILRERADLLPRPRAVINRVCLSIERCAGRAAKS